MQRPAAALPERCLDGGKSWVGYAETDPSGRYGRFKEVLGKGAMKTVYRAFDEVLGMEVAWSQVMLNDVFRSPEEMQRLFSEVHLLKNLNHDSIIKFHSSWIDTDRMTFNFITELFTSGTLREYRKKYQRVNTGAVKSWARQILRGLEYLHGHDPPVIHRDLKCDNIFVNGHLAQVKIGDLGLAAILRSSQHAHSVIGTPEFMAPELYEEEYDELVDIYSFGMCMLEMLTSEYPYSECSNPAQIYKKVTSGKLPEAFYRIQDEEAQEFVGKCLQNVSKRLPARELLLDPFLSLDNDDNVGDAQVTSRVPCRNPIASTSSVEKVMPLIPMVPDEEPVRVKRNAEMNITGTINPEDDAVYLKVQISDKEGDARNVYFAFDIVNDSASEVAEEMVKELEITDWKPAEIAQMIEDEICSLVPNWKNCKMPRNMRQCSFNYQDEDDDVTNHPVYISSSRSSSQASLRMLNTSFNDNYLRIQSSINSCQNWLQDCDGIIYDDATSPSSVNSCKYANLNYCSGSEEDDCDTVPQVQPICNANFHQSTRFCPQENRKNMRNRQQLNMPSHASSSRQQHRMTRNRSLIDVRSHQLHRSLVEEINKRRLFKTVGAIENIGYQEPYGFSGKKNPIYGVAGTSSSKKK